MSHGLELYEYQASGIATAIHRSHVSRHDISATPVDVRGLFDMTYQSQAHDVFQVQTAYDAS